MPLQDAVGKGADERLQEHRSAITKAHAESGLAKVFYVCLRPSRSEGASTVRPADVVVDDDVVGLCCCPELFPTIPG